MPLHEEIGPVKIYSPTKPGGVWQVTWTPPGMLRQVKQRKTEKKAVALAKEIRGQLKRGEIGRVHRVTRIVDAVQHRHRILDACLGNHREIPDFGRGRILASATVATPVAALLGDGGGADAQAKRGDEAKAQEGASVSLAGNEETGGFS